MTDNRNEITVDNSVLILIDHQPWVAFAVNSIDLSLLSNNLEGLASSAKALDVPAILTTVGGEGGKLRDPLMRAVADVFPDKTNGLSPRARPARRAAPNTNAGGRRWRNRLTS
jgi:nicotinamidase-related amidase